MLATTPIHIQQRKTFAAAAIAAFKSNSEAVCHQAIFRVFYYYRDDRFIVANAPIYRNQF